MTITGLTVQIGVHLVLITFIGFRTGRDFVDYFLGMWLCVVGVIIEYCHGVEFVIYGDQFRRDDDCLILMNHRTRLDWLFAWPLIGKIGRLEHLKIIMKKELGKIPAVGWGMQGCGYLFLSRDWAKDEEYLTSSVEFYGKIGYPIQLLIFPEGTDKTERTTASSNKFAEKAGLPTLDYLLHPRAKGLYATVKSLKKTNGADVVYDITVAYPDKVPQNGDALFTGFPAEIHWDVKRISIWDIPESEEEVEQWIRNLWYEKEEKLRKFYEKGSFDSPRVHYPTPTFFYIRSVAYWVISGMFFFYLYFNYSFFFWLFSIAFIALGILGSTYGIGNYERRLYNNTTTALYPKKKRSE
jgi:lysocardiolipin and lysophospholipid acyltransferase